MPVGVSPRGPRCQQWRLLGLLGLAVLHHRFTCTHTHTGRNRPDHPTDGLTGGTYRAIRTPFLIRGFQGSTRSKRLCLPITSFRTSDTCCVVSSRHASMQAIADLDRSQACGLLVSASPRQRHPLITSGHRETTAAASARAACRASGASRAGLWRSLTGRRSAAAAPGAACFRRRDLSGLSTRVGSGGG